MKTTSVQFCSMLRSDVVCGFTKLAAHVAVREGISEEEAAHVGVFAPIMLPFKIIRNFPGKNDSCQLSHR